MKLLSVPSDQGNLGKNKGCSKAPEQILQGKEFETIEIVKGNFEETDKAIYKKAKQVLEEGKALFVGGDHSVSYALVKAFSEVSGKKKALVVFDAHPDCVQFFKPLSHEDWVQGIVEEELVEKERVLLIGVRKVHEMERDYLKKKGIKVVSALEVKTALQQAKDKLLELVATNEQVYVSIDIDVFDPSIAAGTGYLEKNGLMEKEFFALLRPLLESGKVKAMDLVEVNPVKDRGETVELAKRILEKALKASKE